MTSSIVSDGTQEDSSDTSIIVSHWNQLASMDNQSPGFSSLLSSLMAKDNRSSTINLRAADARVVLDAMDKVLGDGRVSNEHQHDALDVMRKLAYNSGQVPTRYEVGCSLSVGMNVVASGAFAEVRKGMLGGKEVAIKTLRVDREGGEELQKLFCKESVMWMNLSHPNILRLIGVEIDSQTGRCSMVSEMMTNGNIREYIRKHSPNRHNLLKDAAVGLNYLHQRGIVHGDLKGNNILITNDDPPRACLADFGLSTLAPSADGVTKTVTTGGTLLYMAPELLFPTKFGFSSATPTKAADIYAFGMVIYEVLTGLRPFQGKDWPIVEAYYHVVSGERPTRPGDAEQMGFGDETWDFVQGCWAAKPTERPVAELVSAHLERVAEPSVVVGPTPKKPPNNTSEITDISDATQVSDSTTTIQHDASISASLTVVDRIPDVPRCGASQLDVPGTPCPKVEHPHSLGDPHPDIGAPLPNAVGPPVDAKCPDTATKYPQPNAGDPDADPGGPYVPAGELHAFTEPISRSSLEMNVLPYVPFSHNENSDGYCSFINVLRFTANFQNSSQVDSTDATREQVFVLFLQENSRKNFLQTADITGLHRAHCHLVSGGEIETQSSEINERPHRT